MERVRDARKAKTGRKDLEKRWSDVLRKIEYRITLICIWKMLIIIVNSIIEH